MKQYLYPQTDICDVVLNNMLCDSPGKFYEGPVDEILNGGDV